MLWYNSIDLVLVDKNNDNFKCILKFNLSPDLCQQFFLKAMRSLLDGKLHHFCLYDVSLISIRLINKGCALIYHCLLISPYF